MVRRRTDGSLVVVCGSSRSGKTAWTMQQIKKASRVLVWDLKHDPRDYRDGFQVIDNEMLHARALKDAGKGPGRYRFQAVRPGQFDFWCRCALAWGKIAPCVIVAEELADVTSPGKAPGGWGRLVRTGRGFGIDTYAITQRPAESDKSSFGNASLFHCGMLARRRDRQYMADEMDCDRALLDALRPLDWVERVPGGGLKTGRVSLKS